MTVLEAMAFLGVIDTYCPELFNDDDISGADLIEKLNELVTEAQSLVSYQVYEK